MLLKLTLRINNFVRVRKEKAQEATKTLTKKDWINADRIVMILLLVGVIIAAIIFS